MRSATGLTGLVVTDAEVTLADVLSLRIAAEEPLSDGTLLVLRQRGTGAERRVTLGSPAAGPASGPRGSGGRTRDASVAVSLAPLALTPGRWDAYLQQGDSRTRIRSADPGFSLDRLDAYALGLRTMAYRTYRTRNGFLAIKIDRAEPIADVRAVWFREGRFEVTGLLAYTGLGDDDQHHRARLTLRLAAEPDGTALASLGEEAERADAAGDAPGIVVAATVHGVRFHAALSLCDVLAATPDGQGVWVPYMDVDGMGRRLPLGARLDDVEGKRRRIHYPHALMDGVPIRPAFTKDDELRLEVGA
ncbi:hypothetical protein [Sphaerimonospora thailandensis]|uniref:Uncharacterized protein n=1 Tax=Sphaerimonospora thailandensis TaxID=795644 RepID=A0A8J3RAS0_9ACTN|nr:hypothetical protein [Sphaerimonospora thailandensis]GIH70866.1 hypothetical protein Mth01_31190 [Sphaerimonospora thailandensis]